jgi:hypothetical protein
MWHVWGTEDAYRVLLGKPDGNSSLGRPRNRWEDNINLDLQEMEWGGMDWLLWLRIGTDGGRL